MNIVGKKVVLRAIEPADLPDLNRWSNNPELQYWLGGFHFPASLEVQRQWLTRIQSDERDLRFAIDAEDLGLIGLANLVDINWKDRNAFHGMQLGEKDLRGKGYGTDTVMAIMRYAFEELGLERLDSSMIEYNEPSLRLYCDRCGWRREGVRRRWYFRKDRYWDKVIVGVTRDDYIELIAKTKYWA